MPGPLLRYLHLLESEFHAPQKGAWRPAADVYRVDGDWLVKFDLAGVRPEDIELQLSGRRLTIRGARRDLAIQSGSRSYSLEIAYNRFERTLELPEELDHAEARMEYRDGMLLVWLTKQPRHGSPTS